MNAKLDETELKRLIPVALSDAGQASVLRDGRSAYDIVCDAIRSLAEGDDPDQIPELILQFSKEGANQPLSWWLRFLNLFEEIAKLSQRHRILIQTALLENAPQDLKIQAIILRFLAYRDCPIPWSNLPKALNLASLKRAEPATIADAFVWSDDFTNAAKTLTSAFRTQGIERGTIEKLAERWESRVGPQGADFLAELSLIGALKLSPEARKVKSAQAVKPSASDWAAAIRSFGLEVQSSSRRFAPTAEALHG